MMGGNEGCGGGSFKREGIYVYLLLILLNCGVEKTLKSPLDCKEIQPVHSKGDQSWMFFGRTDAKAETPILCLATSCEELTHWKRSGCWERLKAGGEGDDRR